MSALSAGDLSTLRSFLRREPTCLAWPRTVGRTSPRSTTEGGQVAKAVTSHRRAHRLSATSNHVAGRWPKLPFHRWNSSLPLHGTDYSALNYSAVPPRAEDYNRIIDGRMMKSNQAGTTKNTKEVSSLFAICAFFAAIPPSRVRELVRAFGRRLVAVEGSWAVRLFPHTAERGPALATSRQSV